MFSKKIIFFIILGALSLFIILEGLTEDYSFLYKTNVAKIVELYQPIKENKNIKIIAAYPMTLSNGSSGFPCGYQLLGQMVHEKTMVGGADPFAIGSSKIYSDVADVSNSETINILTMFGVDTIIIYDQLLDNSVDVINRLRQDDRLVYVGHYTVSPDDNPYICQNDLSKSIYVFQIKKVVENVIMLPNIYSDAGQLFTNYQSAYKILINTSGMADNGHIYFRQPFSSSWKLYLPKEAFDFWGIAYLWEKPLFDDTHQMIEVYGNRWTIDTQEIGRDFKLVLCFQMQLYENFFRLIAAATVLICLGYVGLDWGVRRRKK